MIEKPGDPCESVYPFPENAVNERFFAMSRSLILIVIALYAPLLPSQSLRTDLNCKRLEFDHTLYWIDEGKARAIVANDQQNLWDPHSTSSTDASVATIARGPDLNSAYLATTNLDADGGTVFFIDEDSRVYRPVTQRGASACGFAPTKRKVDEYVLHGYKTGPAIDYPGNGLVDDHVLASTMGVDLESRRSLLKKMVWGSDLNSIDSMMPTGPPSAPTSTDLIPTESRFCNQCLLKVERINLSTTIPLVDGTLKKVDSFGFVFIPNRPIKGAVIVHQGHSPGLDGQDGPFNVDQTILRLNQEGFLVVGLRMPLCQNAKDHDCDHKSLFTASPPSKGNPLRYFLEPVIRATNYILDKYPALKTVDMIGLSGGGWTTVLSSAVDPRIRMSVQVAGTLPLSMSDPKEVVEPEQFALRDVYQAFGYKDLYLLDAAGKGRVTMQVVNQSDSCCYSESFYRNSSKSPTPNYRDALVEYSTAINHSLKSLDGGRFCLHIDTTNVPATEDPTKRQHQISLQALDSAVKLFEIGEPSSEYCLRALQ